MRSTFRTVGITLFVTILAISVTSSQASDVLDDAQREWSAGQRAYNDYNYHSAQQHLQTAYDILRRLRGAEDKNTLDIENDLAAAKAGSGDLEGAERLYHDLYEEQTRAASEQALVFRTLNNWSAILLEEGRAREAADLALRTYSEERQSLGLTAGITLATLNNLCEALVRQGSYREAEDRLDEVYRAQFQRSDLNDTHALKALAILTEAIEGQGRDREAERYATALFSAQLKTLGADHPDTIAALVLLANVMERENRLSDAEQRLREALAASTTRSGEANSVSLEIKDTLARVLRSEQKFERAAKLYRETCPQLLQATSSTALTESSELQNASVSDCYYRLALTLRDVSVHDAVNARALGAEAFLAAQHAQAESATSLSRSNAVALAAGAGVGEAAAEYEMDLDQRRVLQVRFAQSVDRNERQTLSHTITQLNMAIDGLASELARKSPDYWNYRSPQPTPIAALQRKNSPTPELLHNPEALVLWMCRADDNRGLVFAVGPGTFGWSSVGLTGKEIADRVQTLRGEIESAGGATGTRRTPFNRSMSHELYLALLGDKSIQAVIAKARTLLVVPCGPLANLPPSLLVVAEPPGGRAADADPVALRRTRWLAVERAIAILPTVSALEILRLRRRHPGSEPLLAFADPDTSGVRGRNGAEDQWLKLLESLPATKEEARALESILGGHDDELLIGPRANKDEIQRRARDGSLAQVNVLEFATHGFLPGEIPEIPDASLALAATPFHSDVTESFLAASEISRLHLNADWVVLSACNTGRTVRPGGEGLSEFARAFFYAGAQSLLVSHWRIRDDAAKSLVILTFEGRKRNPQLDKAQALQNAMLLVLNDTKSDGGGHTLADPSAWASFVVLGDVD